MRYEISVVKPGLLSFRTHPDSALTEGQARALYRSLRACYPAEAGFAVSVYQIVRIEEIAHDITEEMDRRLAAEPYGAFEVQPVEIGVI